MNGEGVVKITRVSELFFFLEPVDIYIDNVRVGRILAGDQKEFHIDQGKHRITIKTDIILYGSFSGNTVEIEIGEDGIVDLECGSNYQGMKVFLSKLCILNKHDTFYIKEASV